MIEAQDVREMLARMTFPARRHRCPDCHRVFECHLCTIEETHILHTEGAECPLFCLECAERKDIRSIAVLSGNRNPHEVKFYDYHTGELERSTSWLRGWESEGRSDGIWRFCEKLYTGVKRFIGRGV